MNRELDEDIRTDAEKTADDEIRIIAENGGLGSEEARHKAIRNIIAKKLERSSLSIASLIKFYAQGYILSNIFFPIFFELLDPADVEKTLNDNALPINELKFWAYELPASGEKTINLNGGEEPSKYFCLDNVRKWIEEQQK